jgi:hypothetical protein
VKSVWRKLAASNNIIYVGSEGKANSQIFCRCPSDAISYHNKEEDAMAWIAVSNKYFLDRMSDRAFTAGYGFKVWKTKKHTI